MNSYLVFTAKELREQLKTFKGFVIFIVVTFFGIVSPLFAKLTPELMKLANTGNIEIKMRPQTFLDSYSQFFKNISQMVLIVLILVFCGSVVSETTKGTASMMLTKRLSRSAFIMAKYTSGAVIWTAAYWSSAALAYVYTCYLFPSGKPQHLILSFLCMWLFGLLTLSVSIFCSTVFKNYALAAVGGFCLTGLISLTSAVGKIKDYMPCALQTINPGLIGGSVSPAMARVPVLTGILLTTLLLALSCVHLNRREL